MFDMDSHRRFGRRKVLRGGAAFATGIAGAALIGCSARKEAAPAASAPAAGGSPAAAGAAPAGTKKYGGTFRRAVVNIESNFDVYMSQGASQLFSSISERLVRVDPKDMSLQPGLLSKWEVVEGGLDYILHIQPGAVWEDKAPTNGRPFDAEDVAWNIKYAAELAGPKHTAQRSSWYAGIDTATAVDGKTVRLKFKKPNAAILSAMGDHRQHIVPKEVPEKWGWSKYPDFPSVGPYTVKNYKEGQSASMVKNPKYSLKDGTNQMPYFDGLALQWFGDPASALAALISDQIDAFAVTASDAKQIEAKKDKALKIIRKPFRHSQLQVLSWKAYPDVRVRQAFHRLIDYTDLGQNVLLGDFGYSGPINNTYPYVMKSDAVKKLPGFNPDTRKADVEEAHKLLSAAGFPNGAGLKIDNVSSATTGNPFDWMIRIQGQLQQAAPKIEYKTTSPQDQPSFQRGLLAGRYSAITHQSLDGPDVRLAIQAFQTGHSRNWSQYSNATVDALIAKSMAQDNKADLAQTIGQIEAQLLKDMPWYVLGVVPAVAARSRFQQTRMEAGWEGGGGNDLVMSSQYFWFDSNA